jgi:hypothetical protein
MYGGPRDGEVVKYRGDLPEDYDEYEIPHTLPEWFHIVPDSSAGRLHLWKGFRHGVPA